MANILVVDDEVGIRELLSDILSDEGYNVSTAEDARSARQQVTTHSFDLILLDIWMPDTDGITLLKEWGARKAIDCPVIMMSGHGTIETAVEATKLGALSFLEKPITMQKLLEAVSNGLQVHERLKRFAAYRAPETVPVRPAPQQPAARLPVLQVPGTNYQIDFNLSLREVREATEKSYLEAVMNFEHCQMTRVARHAGLERTHLYRKLKALNMEIPRGHRPTTADSVAAEPVAEPNPVEPTKL